MKRLYCYEDHLFEDDGTTPLARHAVQVVRESDQSFEVARLNTEAERGCFVLMEMMKAYERRIRTACRNQEELDKRPWECAEYLQAADFLKKVWPRHSAGEETARHE